MSTQLSFFRSIYSCFKASSTLRLSPGGPNIEITSFLAGFGKFSAKVQKYLLHISRYNVNRAGTSSQASDFLATVLACRFTSPSSHLTYMVLASPTISRSLVLISLSVNSLTCLV